MKEIFSVQLKFSDDISEDQLIQAFQEILKLREANNIKFYDLKFSFLGRFIQFSSIGYLVDNEIDQNISKKMGINFMGYVLGHDDDCWEILGFKVNKNEVIYDPTSNEPCSLREILANFHEIDENKVTNEMLRKVLKSKFKGKEIKHILDKTKRPNSLLVREGE